ncbi:MAG TPA: hypothetical protein VMS40_10735 [Vicinamibacterales bacterium]|nr:hypothetical protein [Vicinamibacterales bacterium]
MTTPIEHATDRTTTYRAAIDATVATLASRARSYRILILVAGIGICVAGLWVLLARSAAPLILLVLVVASVGAFFWLDALVMNRWRAQLLQPWQRRELDFTALAAAVHAIPGLPADSVAAMLASLPRSPDLVRERELTAGARQELASQLLARDRRHATRLLLKTLGVFVGGIAIGFLLLSWT